MLNVNDHPAVKYHRETLVGEFQKQDVPNHDDLVPYLKQLPTDSGYTMIEDDDAEHNLWDTENYDVPTGIKAVGLAVQWDRQAGYGGCQMVTFPNGKVGLRIWINGCPLASAYPYYILQAGWNV